MKKYQFFKTNSGLGSGVDIAALQTAIKQNYLNKYYNIFMTKFKWSGLDEELKEQQENYIMRKLWSEGTIAARYVKDLDILVFTNYATATINLYDLPETVTLLNLHAVPTKLIPNTPQVVNKDVVLGWAQPNKKPIASIVNYYIDRMTQIDLVINTNLNLQKMPFLIGVTETDKQKMQDIVNRMLNNETVVFTDLEDIQKIQSIATTTPYIIDKLASYKTVLENELLTFLGIDNNGGASQKAERLLTDEVNATNDLICDYGYAIEDSIKKWLEQVNRIFGRKITIEPVSKPVQSVHEEINGVGDSTTPMDDKEENEDDKQ